jgi:hypothetical protein
MRVLELFLFVYRDIFAIKRFFRDLLLYLASRFREEGFAILTLAPHFIDSDGPICHSHRLSK